MMGSGKTTIGRLLAQRLGRVLLDSDELVEARTGETVAQIFAERGEAAFRAEERAVLTQALASDTPAVIAAAGGTVLDADNRARIAGSGLVVWLRAKPSVLAERVPGGTHRPLLEHDPAGVLQRLDREREPLYHGIADVIVDTDVTDPDVAVERIAALVSGGRAR